MLRRDLYQPGSDISQLIPFGSAVEVDVLIHDIGMKQLRDRIGLCEPVDHQKQVPPSILLLSEPVNSGFSDSCQSGHAPSMQVSHTGQRLAPSERAMRARSRCAAANPVVVFSVDGAANCRPVNASPAMIAASGRRTLAPLPLPGFPPAFWR